MAVCLSVPFAAGRPGAPASASVVLALPSMSFFVVTPRVGLQALREALDQLIQGADAVVHVLDLLLNLTFFGVWWRVDFVVTPLSFPYWGLCR